MRKRIIIPLVMLMTLAACCLLSACNTNRGGDKNTGTEPEQTVKKFDSIENYASVQGYHNWYYYCGDVEVDDHTAMTYSDYYARYNSVYAGIYYDTYVMREYWLLGETGQSVGMGFRAPYSEEARISVEFTLLSSNARGDLGLQMYSNNFGDGYGEDFRDPLTRNYSQYGEKNKLTDSFSYSTKRDEELFFMFYGSTQAYAKVHITIEYR